MDKSLFECWVYNRSPAPYNGLDYDFRVRSGAIAGPARARLPPPDPPQHGRKMP